MSYQAPPVLKLLYKTDLQYPCLSRKVRYEESSENVQKHEKLTHNLVITGGCGLLEVLILLVIMDKSNIKKEKFGQFHCYFFIDYGKCFANQDLTTTE